MRHNIIILGGAALGFVLGCSGDTTGTAPTASSVYIALVLNQHAINMSVTDPVSNTIQLTATPVDANGDAIVGAGPATFQTIAGDSTVTVSATGLVTAHTQNTNGALVIATLQYRNTTHVDTAFIRVTTNGLPALATVTIPDSALGTVQVAAGYTPPIQGKDINNTTVHFSGPQGSAYYAWIVSSNPQVADFNKYDYGIDRADGVLTLADTGHVTLQVTSWYYGTTVDDSIKLFVSWPVTQTIIVDGTRQQVTTYGTKFLGVGGVVTWVCSSCLFSGDPEEALVFDTPAAVDSALDSIFGMYSGTGNLSMTPDVPAMARSFPVAGTYHYHNPADPLSAATIFVIPNPTP